MLLPAGFPCRSSQKSQYRGVCLSHEGRRLRLDGPMAEPKLIVVRFLRHAAPVNRTHCGLSLILVGIITACGGSNGTDTTNSAGGGPAAGGNLGNAGATGLGGASSNQAGASSTLGGFS